MHNKRSSLSLVIAGLVLITLTGFSHAEDRKIGVAVSAVINGTDASGLEVSEALGAAIETVLKATVVAGSASQNQLPDAARSETCLGDSACLVAAGKALGVDELLMLIIIDSEEEVKVEATWVDVATGKTALRSSISAAKSSDALAELFLVNASNLLPDVELRPADTEVAPVDNTNTGDNTNNTVDLMNTGGQQDTGTEPRGRHLIPATKILGYTGAGLVVASGIMGGIRLVGCDFKLDGCDSEKTTADKVADGFLGVGLVALVVTGIHYQWFSASDEKEPVISVSASDESLGLVYGGRF